MRNQGAARIPLHLALSSAWVVVVILVTTTPWSDFQGHPHWGMVEWVPFTEKSVLSLRFQADLVGNLLLFMPLGFWYAGARSARSRRCLLEAALCSLLLSASVELFQVYMHNRIPSMTDVTMNVTGALAGAYMGLTMNRRRAKA